MRILGIDPSLLKTGWGIIDTKGSLLKCVSYGVIKTSPKWKIEDRLSFIHSNVCDILNNIDIVCIEETFCGMNPVTNLRLGFASGAIISAVGLNSLPLVGYSTRKIKQTLTGNGSANKHDVMLKVCNILNIPIDNLDSSDALAAAITKILIDTDLSI